MLFLYFSNQVVNVLNNWNNLYIGKDILFEYYKEKIENALIEFPFWPHTHNTKIKTISMNCKTDCCVHDDQITFWSENHALMLLSSAHLFRLFFSYMHRSIRNLE